jgi:hypothetical protein
VNGVAQAGVLKCAFSLPARTRASALDAGTPLVVDIGTSRGVHDGDVLELWRPVRLRHPVTSATLVDRFRIGSLRLTQVRSALSLSVIEGAVSRPPATGDVVIPRRRARRRSRPSTRTRAP